MAQERVGQAIELRVERVAQLFQTLDPFPFPEKDLDREAEEFIVGWARELPRDGDIRIIVHLPQSEVTSEHAKSLGEAIGRYFAYRADMVTLDLKEMLRIGRRSLVIGATVLAVCIIVAQGLSRIIRTETVAEYVSESLLILGWVANWRPIEILLYDWWPIARRRNLMRRLARADVELRPFTPRPSNAAPPARTQG